MFHLFTELPKGLGKCNRNVVKFGYVLICLSAVFQMLSVGSAQAYAGKYVEANNVGNELILTYEGDGLYSGVLFEGVGIYAVQANEEDVVLKGLILKNRGGEQDVSFFATLGAGQLVLKTNLVTSDGEIDTTSQAEVIYISFDAEDVENNTQTTESSDTQIVATPEVETNSDTEISLASFSVRTGTLTGEHIEPDQQYWGGAKLQLANVGIAFEVPSAGTAIHTPPQQTVVIGHTSTLGNVAVHALSTGDFDAFVASHTMAQITAQDNQVLEAITEAIKTEDFYRSSYKLTTGTRTSYIEIAAQKAPSGNMVLLKAKSRMQEAQDISLVVNMLLESLIFAEVPEVSLKTDIMNSRVSSVNKTDEALGFIDLCSSFEFRLENFENAEDIQIGLWKPAVSIFSSGIVLNSIAGDFHYVALEDDVATFDDSVLLIEPSPYCQ